MEHIVTDRNETIKNMADAALNDTKELDSLVELLNTGSRRERQMAASAVTIVARQNPELLTGKIDVLIDALNRPEAQTRWECLETLAIMVEFDARACGKAIPEAEASLFDEESGPVRLAAMRYLCALGATTANRSEKVWPLIDEGIQCYHGDLEFNDMLTAITEFSCGKLSDSVKEQLKERMSFDATSGKGAMKKRAQAIIDNLA